MRVRPWWLLRWFWLALATLAGGCATFSVPARHLPEGPAVFYEPSAPPVPTRPIASSLLRQAEVAQSEKAGILNVGEDALALRLHLIRAARESIAIQTFIWVDDTVGSFLFEELVQAARRGVKVRLLVDQLVPPTRDSARYAYLARAHPNIEWRVYRPIFDHAINDNFSLAQGIMFRLGRLNTRMHLKVFLVDEVVAIVGGRNVQDAYFDWDPEFNFKDRDALVIGPLTREISAAFDQHWDHRESIDVGRLVDVARVLRRIEAGQARFPSPIRQDPHLRAWAWRTGAEDISTVCHQFRMLTVERALFVADPPEKPGWRERRDGLDPWQPYRDVISSAEESLLLQTPYLVMGRDERRLLRNLRLNRPDLRMVFSTNSLAAADHVSVAAMAFKQRKMQYRRLGADIYQWRPVPDGIAEMVPRHAQLQAIRALQRGRVEEEVLPLDVVPILSDGPRYTLHAKTTVVDGRVAFVGTHNFDPRSSTINTECGVLLFGEAIAREVERDILRDIAPGNSWVTGKRRTVPVISAFSRLVGAVSTWLPVLDVWPFQYTSCFELREGAEPVPPRHPDFYQNYVDVGDFPEVALGYRALKARLFRAFAGWAIPLM